MEDLETQLINSKEARNRIIVTDGVFSMDGTIAQLDKICDLASRYDALVMSDECHSTGFIGPNGKGVPEELGVMDKVDIITGIGSLMTDLILKDLGVLTTMATQILKKIFIYHYD